MPGGATSAQAAGLLQEAAGRVFHKKISLGGRYYLIELSDQDIFLKINLAIGSIYFMQVGILNRPGELGAVL